MATNVSELSFHLFRMLADHLTNPARVWVFLTRSRKMTLMANT
jgi:hypothetical protein